LPPGKWMITVNMVITKTTVTASTETWLVRSSFSNSTTTLAPSTDIIGGPLVSGILTSSSAYGFLQGSIVINNTSGADKTYYYIAGNVTAINATAGDVKTFGGTYWGEDNIFFQKIN